MYMQDREMADQIYEFCKAIEVLDLRTKYEVFATEFKCLTTHTIDDVQFAVEGTLDAIAEHEGRYLIVDWKTASKKWTDQQYEVHLQKKIYTWLLAKIVGTQNVVGFDYVVLTKKKKPDIQIWHYDYSLDTLVEDLLQRYVVSHKKDQRPATRNAYCFGC